MDIKYGTGRRKTSIARVYVQKGKGSITVNEKDYKDYFSTAVLHNKVVAPLSVTDNINKYDITVNVHGGGINGQAEALSLGLSRALIQFNSEWRPGLKSEGLLRRDPRMVERKKFGQKKARKKFQFSKR